MPSILKEISEWGAELPYWEQSALEKIIAGAEINDELLDELLRYLLEDAGLQPRRGSRPSLRFFQAAARDGGERHDMVRLRRIADLRNINALAPDQVLEFGDKLTVIFGANGSGKSGYARVIASAAFTRGDKQILPDITRPQNSSEPLSATLEIEMDGEPVKIYHEIGQTCAAMRLFYVFDSTSVRAHLTHSNPMSFSPAGLETLTRLVEVTDAVRRKLQQRVDSMKCENPFLYSFSGGETEVSKAISALGAKSDLDEIRRLGTLSEEESQRIGELDLEIARLKSENAPEKIIELGQTIEDLGELAGKLHAIREAVSDERAARLQDALKDRASASRAVKAMGIEQFQNRWFHSTGSPVWYEFIQAAQRLAQDEAAADSIYPESGERCLLCLQPLDGEAHARLHRFWEFLESDAKERLDRANQLVLACITPAQALELDLLSDQAVSYRHLQAQDGNALEHARRLLEAARQRRETLMRSVQENEVGYLDRLPEGIVGELERITGRLEAEREALAARKVEEEIERLGEEMLELEHRKLLGERLEGVVKYVEDARWIEKASSSRVKRSSAHISSMYNKLFDRLVTQEYLRLFYETLKKLNCPLMVEIKTEAKKGRTIKYITLRTDASVTAGQATPEKVLSEGEQRAVALADFFTEVRLDQQSCGVVLDDPVTSLDFEWKETIARYIVEEAERQQVIVFTHDLHFLSLLHQMAEGNVETEAHWIQRRGDVPGWVYPGNSPMAERDYRKPTRAREHLVSAREAALTSAEMEQMHLEHGFGALRTTYEVFVMHELFQDVVLRFQERVSGDRLRNVYIDESIRDEVVEAMGRLSRYITAHSHSDFHGAQKPTAKKLEEEIACFEGIQLRHKKVRKEKGLDK